MAMLVFLSLFLSFPPFSFFSPFSFFFEPWHPVWRQKGTLIGNFIYIMCFCKALPEFLPNPLLSFFSLSFSSFSSSDTQQNAAQPCNLCTQLAYIPVGESAHKNDSTAEMEGLYSSVSTHNRPQVVS